MSERTNLLVNPRGARLPAQWSEQEEHQAQGLLGAAPTAAESQPGGRPRSLLQAVLRMSWVARWAEKGRACLPATQVARPPPLSSLSLQACGSWHCSLIPVASDGWGHGGV